MFEGLDFFSFFFPTVRYRGCRFFFKFQSCQRFSVSSLWLLSIIFFLQNLEQNGVYLFPHLTLATKYLFSSLFFVNVTRIVVYSNSESAGTGYLLFQKGGLRFCANLLQRICLEIFLPDVNKSNVRIMLSVDCFDLVLVAVECVFLCWTVNRSFTRDLVT